jgi:hypothetical protein
VTTTIRVTVNGNYKTPVKRGVAGADAAEEVTWVSGWSMRAPLSMDFHPHDHGDGTVFVIGPEEPDNGDPVE